MITEKAQKNSYKITKIRMLIDFPPELCYTEKEQTPRTAVREKG